MNQEFKDWLGGVAMFLLATLILWTIGVFINPQEHYSLLEWWGIIMLLVVIRSGIIDYYEGGNE